MPAYKDIPIKELYILYILKKLSGRKIAKLYNCAYSTIDSKIIKAGFPRRNRAQSHIIYPKKDFDGSLIDKAYLIGFRIGDLRVRKTYKHSETIKIDCASSKKAQLVLIKDLFSKYGHVWVGKTNKKGSQQIECSVNISFEFLLPKDPKNWMFKNKKYFFSFLAGFTDAEGSIYISKNQANFSIGNYDIILLKQLKASLENYGIPVGKIAYSAREGLIASHGYRYNHDYWILRISRKLLLTKLFKLLGPYLKHKDRIKQMELALTNIEIRDKLYGA